MVVPWRLTSLCTQQPRDPRTLEELTRWLDAGGDANDFCDMWSRDWTLMGVLVGVKLVPRAIFALLLSHGAQLSSPPDNYLVVAAASGNLGAVQELLLHGIDPRTPIHSYVSGPGWTPLHAASDGGKIEVVAALLNAGADVNARNADERDPPLHEPTVLVVAATSCTCPDTVRLLLHAGVDLDARDRLGRSAEDYARARLEEYRPHHVPPAPNREVLSILSDVRAAGSWKRYVNAPRIDIMMLVLLSSSERAFPPAGVFERLHALPSALAWTILAFWRTPRDAPGGLLDFP